MSEGYGFCGPVPSNLFVVNVQTGLRRVGVFAAGLCPGGKLVLEKLQ